MTYPATTYAEGVELTITSGNQLHEIINGDATEEINTESGMVPSVRKALADSMLFKPAIAWAEGSVESDPFQTRLYGEGIYWAPAASNETPISMGTSPDIDGNWFLAPVTGFDSIASNTNLLSNHNFIIQSPDDITHPSSTPTDYVAGTQIFSGVFVGDDIAGLTYIDGRVSWTSGTLYFSVPNSGALEYVDQTDFVASVADFDGKPRTRGVSYTLVGDEYRVTVGVDALEDESANETLLGSVKFEQGSVATGHEVSSISIGNLSDYTDIVYKASGGSSAVENMISSAPNESQVSSALGTLFKLRENGVPSSIYDYDTLNELHAGSLGVVADYYLSDGSINPSPTDNKDALANVMQTATQYDNLNVLRKKTKSRILLPAGGVATSEPWVIVGGGTYADNGVSVDSLGYKTDIIKTADGNGGAPVDSVIYLQQPSSPQAFACTNVSISNVRLISNNADYGITSQNDVTFFNSEKVNMELGKTGAIGYHWPEFFYVNKITTGHLSCAGRAFVMTRSGTTNVLDNLFAFGCQDGPWKIACVYSNIGSLAADNCAGVMYDLSFSSATTFASLGSESPNATAIIGADLGAQVAIQSVYFQNAESMVGNVVSCGDGCSIEINKLNGYSTTETEQIVSGLRLANVGINARCIIKDYKGFYKFGQRDIIGSSNSTLEVGSGDFGAKNNTIQREDGMHYLGQGRQEFADWYSDSPVVRPKTIFMNHGANAITLNDGSSVQFSGAGLTKGDMIPLDDFDNTGQAILVVKSAGSDFNSSTYEIIQATKVVQTLAELPNTNLWTGRDVKVIDEKKTYTYYPASAGDPAGWYDYNGVIAP